MGVTTAIKPWRAVENVSTRNEVICWYVMEQDGNRERIVARLNWDQGEDAKRIARDHNSEALETLMETVQFFYSAIRSGDPLTAEVERRYQQSWAVFNRATGIVA